MIDEALLAYAVKYGDLVPLQRAGISADHFVDEYRTAWRYLQRMNRTHDTVPSTDTFSHRFPEIDLPRVRKSELPMLVDQAHKRRKFIQFMGHLNDVANGGVDYENVDDKIQALQGQLNTLAFQGDGKAHLVDLFSAETSEQMIAELRRRRAGGVQGIPTGFKRFDRENMGLQKQRMAVIIGRTGIGKSWVDLKFVEQSILSGHRTILYPLEMTLVETAFRLYTVFSYDLYNGSKTIRNLDLQRGHIPMRKIVRLFNLLEDKFAGSLMVADVGSIEDSYTAERIEADVSVHRPDMFWVDYLTLMRPPAGSNRNDADYVNVRKLSNGIAGIAKRRKCVGGCSAQVNREALKTNILLPRLDHISYGDSIGQDADYVFSINRRGEYMYYALVKCRGGMEIGKMRVHFKPNEGLLTEHNEQESDDDDE